jgi:hypothetical protein
MYTTHSSYIYSISGSNHKAKFEELGLNKIADDFKVSTVAKSNIRKKKTQATRKLVMKAVDRSTLVRAGKSTLQKGDGSNSQVTSELPIIIFCLYLYLFIYI